MLKELQIILLKNKKKIASFSIKIDDSHKGRERILYKSEEIPKEINVDKLLNYILEAYYKFKQNYIEVNLSEIK